MPRRLPPVVSRPAEVDIRMRSLSSLEPRASLVVGTSQQFDHLRRLRYIPTPTPDPKDPLNLPPRRKLLALLALALFVAASTAAEAVIAALTNPVLALDYAGTDPRSLAQQNTTTTPATGIISFTPGKASLTPFVSSPSPKPPTSLTVQLIATLPLLVTGISSLILTPLSTHLGRRPVLLLCAALSTTICFLAAFTRTSTQHLIARGILGFSLAGANTLAPLAALELHFLPRRARTLSLFSAAQAFATFALAAAAPYFIARTGLSWRVVYLATGGASALALLGIFLCVPETRWARTPDELGGKDIYSLRAAETRPRLDVAAFGERRFVGDLSVFGGGLRDSSGWKVVFKEMGLGVKSLVYPAVAAAVVMQCALACVGDVVTRTAGELVLERVEDMVRFEKLGLLSAGPLAVVVPLAVWAFGGWLVDFIAVRVAGKNHGRREPESLLVGVALPILAGIGGCMLFGLAGGRITTADILGVKTGTGTVIMLVAGMGLIVFAYLSTNTILSVFLVESYPSLSGPVLVNVTSIRYLVAFSVSFKATDWVEDMGFLQTFGLYGAALGIAAIGLPFVYFYGKRLRAWTAGRLEAAVIKEVESDPV